MNLPQKGWDSAGNTSILPTGHMIEEPSLLFRKIEDEEIEKQVNRLLEAR